MTKKQYIQQLTQAERVIHGKDVPQKASAGVIDGLCDVIADQRAVIADRDAVIASKDDLIAKLSQQVRLFQRQIYGRRSEKLHADIKTGSAPTKKQLLDATMPQIPLEGYIMQSGGFPVKNTSNIPMLQFLQLKKGDVQKFEYSDDEAKTMIDASVQKVKELFEQYSTDKIAAYEYRESVGAKYHEYDDLARVDD